ncbi:type IV secretion system protein TraC [Scandinavium goeteborgense]|uniref:Conjugal transfer ATP-binding protein TraC n=1 Tax=Scandinavium goeteborgense TaxID=1851514 RepID=A0A4R6E195_SCAGO|nr:type IV secretion system protein TraC [Scandinavium goeteborgense]TDN51495.1 conjugal transfer ATP-binding protein TraC [Scandinavium goeteborgense]
MSKLIDAIRHLKSGLTVPDGASEMTRALASMQFPQISSILPYRDYDAKTGLFINKSTIGFLLRATPLSGANETIVSTLEEMVKSKLPRKTPIAFHLVSSKHIGDMLDNGMQDFRWQGKHAGRFNQITKAYYLHATQTYFRSPMNLPLTLRDYRLYISYCVKIKKNSVSQVNELQHTLKVLRASLEAAKVSTDIATQHELVSMVGNLINHRHDEVYEKPVKVGIYDELNQRCVDSSLNLTVRPDDILLQLSDRKGGTTRTRAMNFMMEDNPELFMLWMGGDNISNLSYPDNSIASPFVVTFVMVAEEQVSAQREATTKYLESDKKANSAYVRLFPGVVQKAQEWKEIRERLNTNKTCIVRHYFNITAFCPDNDDDALTCEQQVLNTFRKNGIVLASPVYMQMRNWMAMLPFMHAEGLWDDLKHSGATGRSESAQAVNLLPIVTDNRLSSSGLMMPSYRNQLAFLDLYSDGLGNTNNNMAVTGTSGAGKTNLVQPVLRSVLEAGGIAWVFDMGDGYKSFCENVGGVYLDGRNLKFNPFANITDIHESAERIRDQLAVLASPNGNLDEVHLELLLQGVQNAWKSRAEKARIDDVVAQLEVARKVAIEEGSPTLASRLDEIMTLLGKYCTTGIYGAYFNSDEPSLSDDAKFVVLELGGLDDKPDLLVAVMFSLIIYIENKMYRTPRSLKKCCVIDEGWKLLNFKNDRVGKFIETGYRTVRRHRGAFITITQNIKDFDAEDASTAAKAAWGNSAYKIVLKQDATEFKQYNQRNPNQFSETERDIIGKFGKAQDNWFSSLMLRINDSSTFHRLFLDPLSRAMYSSTGQDFEFIRSRREQGMDIHDAVWDLAWHKWPDEMRELVAIGETL